MILSQVLGAGMGGEEKFLPTITTDKIIAQDTFCILNNGAAINGAALGPFSGPDCIQSIQPWGKKGRLLNAVSRAPG